MDKPKPVTRDWQLDLKDDLEHDEGAVISFTNTPQLYFKPELLMFASSVEDGVEIVSALCGAQVAHMLPSFDKMKVEKQGNNGRAELDFPTIQPYETFSLTVKFLKRCKFEATMFGLGVFPERVEISRA
jgi:hypothetical protein